MATLHLDFVAGKPRSERDEEGWVFTERIARVTGVPGTGYQQHQLALRVFGMPQIGDEHPFIADMLLTRHIPATIEDGTVEVRLRYDRRDEEDNPEYARIDIGTSANQEETNIDSDGTVMKVFKVGSTAPRTKEEQQGGTVSKQVPKSTIVYRRRELGSPGEKSKEFVGKTSAGPWSLDQGTISQWLCTGITGTSIDGGKTYDVTYTFEFDINQWFARVYWIDPTTGKADSDSTEGDGWEEFEIYDSIDFNLLDL